MIEEIIIRAISTGIITICAFFIIRKNRKETLQKDLVVIFIWTYIYGFLFRMVDPNKQISYILELLFMYVFVMTHELGHVCFGYLVGGELESIRIGFGPRLFKIRKLEFRLFPFIGLVKMSGIKGKRSKLLFYAGGLIFQLLAIIVLLFLRLYNMDTVFTHFGELMLSAFFVLNALPIYPELDGAKIIQLFKRNYV